MSNPWNFKKLLNVAKMLTNFHDFSPFFHPFWDFTARKTIILNFCQNCEQTFSIFCQNVNKLWRFFFLSGESMDPDAMICMLEYKNVDGEERPVLMFFKHGLEEIKCWKDQLKTNHFTSNFFLLQQNPVKIAIDDTRQTTSKSRMIIYSA